MPRSANYETIGENILLQLYDRVRYVDSTDQLKLSMTEKSTLRLSWSAWTAGDATQRGFELFCRMFQDHPETKSLFSFAAGAAKQMQTSAKLLFHVSRVIKYITQAVDNVDHLEDVVPLLKSAGGRHGKRGYNVPSNYFPHLGKAMRDLMSENLTNWTVEHDKAWERFFNFIVQQMTHGQGSYGN